MRFVGLAIILISLPLFVFWLQSKADQRKLAYFAVGLLPLTIDAFHLNVSIIDWSMWAGYAKGMQISLLDTLAMAILITHRTVRPTGWLAVPFIAYMAIAAFSAAFAGVWVASTFYFFQLARVFVVFLAVATLATNLAAIRWLASGLAAGMAVQASVAIYQKASGAQQAAGTMVHQNLLGMMTHFVLFPLVGLMLAGKGNKFIAVGVLSALVAVTLGGSRATIGLAAPGLLVLLLLSSARHMTSGKMRMIGFSMVALIAAIPLAMQALSSRSATNDPVSSDKLRTTMERAAHMMIADHPLGVGANQYVVVANSQGYSERAGVIWNAGSRATNVHNFYLLTTAELSWLGTALIALLFVSAIITANKFSWTDRRDPRGDIALGASVGLMIVSVHNFYEWVFVTVEVQYVFAINLGIVAGMVASRKREHAKARKLLRAARASAKFQDAGIEPAAASLAYVQ